MHLLQSVALLQSAVGLEALVTAATDCHVISLSLSIKKMHDYLITSNVLTSSVQASYWHPHCKHRTDILITSIVLTQARTWALKQKWLLHSGFRAGNTFYDKTNPTTKIPRVGEQLLEKEVAAVAYGHVYIATACMTAMQKYLKETIAHAAL